MVLGWCAVLGTATGGIGNRGWCKSAVKSYGACDGGVLETARVRSAGTEQSNMQGLGLFLFEAVRVVEM